MATWSLCTKFGSEQQKAKVFINLDNVITVESLGDRKAITLRERRNGNTKDGAG